MLVSFSVPLGLQFTTHHKSLSGGMYVLSHGPVLLESSGLAVSWRGFWGVQGPWTGEVSLLLFAYSEQFWQCFVMENYIRSEVLKSVFAGTAIFFWGMKSTRQSHGIARAWEGRCQQLHILWVHLWVCCYDVQKYRHPGEALVKRHSLSLWQQRERSGIFPSPKV